VHDPPVGRLRPRFHRFGAEQVHRLVAVLDLWFALARYQCNVAAQECGAAQAPLPRATYGRMTTIAAGLL
jgi:hypothetical protein